MITGIFAPIGKWYPYAGQSLGNQCPIPFRSLFPLFIERGQFPQLLNADCRANFINAVVVSEFGDVIAVGVTLEPLVGRCGNAMRPKYAKALK